ncbi:DUF2173 family protein [Guyparkeria hydrothermalis]|uniref:DUF2173 family protein n=1 Tax=Guyparkeria hydrothermalis TaxID=923 RepID=UPI002021773B|nr:DUF2173 family protein [Guyparkeria hydrothermalis]MCL7744126.1 DUF2173 family protein [Guyparkeria hydrothermalis]
MYQQLLNLAGVEAVVHFRDETGEPWEVHGYLSPDDIDRLTRLANDLKLVTQGHADQMALFAHQPGWTPARGWIVHGVHRSVCGVDSMVAVIENSRASLDEVMEGLAQVSFNV